MDSAFSNELNGQIRILKYNNDLYIGGLFYMYPPLSNVTARCIVRYNGNTFDNMLGGVDGFPVDVFELDVYKGELIVAGDFLQAGGVMGYNNIARWNGTGWDSLGSGVNGCIRSLTIDTVNDVLYTGGCFTMAGGVQVTGVAKWDGTQWSALPTLPAFYQKGGPLALSMFNGKLYAGLDALTSDPMEITFMYLDSSGWQPVYGPGGYAGVVKALEVYNGNLYVAGFFDKIDTTTVNCIACYGDSCPGTPITLTLPYGVNELQKGSLKFKVFPNPAKREITVELPEARSQKPEEKYIVRIKNSLGQEMTQRVIPSGARNLTIDTSMFQKGLYLVEVCTLENVLCHTEKVLIE